MVAAGVATLLSGSPAVLLVLTLAGAAYLVSTLRQPQVDIRSDAVSSAWRQAGTRTAGW
ncbi:MAG TPA: hypothetical protein VIT65_22550 [Microlunatus sp.]